MHTIINDTMQTHLNQTAVKRSNPSKRKNHEKKGGGGEVVFRHHCYFCKWPRQEHIK